MVTKLKNKHQKSFLLLIFSFFLFSCNNNSVKKEFKEIANYFKETHNYEIDQKCKAIFVLTSRGCNSCNKYFSKFMLSNSYDSDVIYLIKASKNAIDLSGFEDYNGVVFYDTDYQKFFGNSKIIFLNNKQIDTIIIIEPQTILDGFQIINQKMQYYFLNKRHLK